MVVLTPEEHARGQIDKMLSDAGWQVQTRQTMNRKAVRVVAVCEFPLTTGEADHLLYADGKPMGVVEAKPAAMTLSCVEARATKYCPGLPKDVRPLGGTMRAYDLGVIVSLTSVVRSLLNCPTLSAIQISNARDPSCSKPPRNRIGIATSTRPSPRPGSIPRPNGIPCPPSKGKLPLSKPRPKAAAPLLNMTMRATPPPTNAMITNATNTPMTIFHPFFI